MSDCTASPPPDSAAKLPIFSKAGAAIADVQISRTLAPDNRTQTVLFDNLSLRLDGPPADPQSIRHLAFRLPIADLTTDTPFHLDLRGAVDRVGAAEVMLLIRVGRDAKLIDLAGVSGVFIETIKGVLRPGDDLRLTLVLMVERYGTDPASAMLTVDSVELAF